LADRPDQNPLEYLSRAGRLAPTSAEEAVESPQRVSTGPNSLEVFAARAVLKGVQDLQTQGGQDGVRLFECARQIGMAADQLLPLARELVAGGLLQTLEPDAIGDDLVSISPAGATLLSDNDSGALAKRLTK
jgi:hypothetical protein